MTCWGQLTTTGLPQEHLKARPLRPLSHPTLLGPSRPSWTPSTSGVEWPTPSTASSRGRKCADWTASWSTATTSWTVTWMRSRASPLQQRRCLKLSPWTFREKWPCSRRKYVPSTRMKSTTWTVTLDHMASRTRRDDAGGVIKFTASEMAFLTVEKCWEKSGSGASCNKLCSVDVWNYSNGRQIKENTIVFTCFECLSMHKSKKSFEWFVRYPSGQNVWIMKERKIALGWLADSRRNFGPKNKYTRPMEGVGVVDHLWQRRQLEGKNSPPRIRLLGNPCTPIHGHERLDRRCCFYVHWLLLLASLFMHPAESLLAIITNTLAGTPKRRDGITYPQKRKAHKKSKKKVRTKKTI